MITLLHPPTYPSCHVICAGVKRERKRRMKERRKFSFAPNAKFCKEEKE
jgi:hypothetical protein